ncbi:MAG TPA: NUDIX hydrolase [Dehalococcoidia bacterium]|nr:NUDIX hydrolase [Dehalococcoidia bacterium]
MTDPDITPRPMIRAASMLLDNGKTCLVKQEVTEKRHWAFPGGKLELREKLSECVSREFKEETGLDVRVRELLYVTNRITSNPDTHVVHISFLVEKCEKRDLPEEWTHVDPFPSTSSVSIREIRMVKIDDLEQYGFSTVFCGLVKDGFPGRGSYKGDFFVFYDE